MRHLLLACLLALFALPARAAAPRRSVAELASIERPAALARFFEAVARCEAPGAREQVRVVQFGDSHTAADVFTSTVRAALQARFGDGGRGFVSLGVPFPGYRPSGARPGMTADWGLDRAPRLKGARQGDGRYGLLGVGFAASSPGARAWAELSAPASTLELSYLAHPTGAPLEVVVDGATLGRIPTRAARPQSAWQTIDVPEGPHTLEVRVQGEGEARVFGVSLERGPGLIWESAGISGARAWMPLEWDEAHFAEQLVHAAPALVVLAYGTNEVGDRMPVSSYERQFAEVLGRVARAAPSAACLVVGPPDRGVRAGEGWVTPPRLLEIVAAQRRSAEAAGCAFFSQLEAMGGEGAIAAWALEEPPRAMRDRVHLHREGYTQLGAAFAAELLRSYGAWRERAATAP